MTGAMDLVKDAKASIENLTPEQVAAEIDSGDVVVVDLREPTETEAGVVPGAVRAPRGMLEFYADPELPYHLDEFDRGTRTILYCASGGRSALAVKTLEQMGYEKVAHMDGGFKAWAEEGRPVSTD